MAYDLLDELRHWIHPFLSRLARTACCSEMGTRSMFDVIETMTYKSGIVLLSYRLKPTADGA